MKKILLGLIVLFILILSGCEDIDVSETPDEELPPASEFYGACSLPSGMVCRDFAWAGDGFLLEIQNSGGVDMSEVSVNVVPDVGISGTCIPSTMESLPDGEDGLFVIPCSGIATGMFNGDVVVDYTNAQTGLQHTKTGEIIARIEPEDTSSKLPVEMCIMPSGMACLDFAWTGASMDLIIQNAAGFGMENILITIIPKEGTAGACVMVSEPSTLPDGQQAIYSIPCSSTKIGAFKGDIQFSYVNVQTGIRHTKIGEIVVKVE